MNKYLFHVVLPNEELADWFLENFYPYSMKLLVVTCDGSYPKDPELRKNVWESFENDPNIQIMVFGYLPPDINPKTTAVIYLNDLLRYELRSKFNYENQDYGKKRQLNLTPINFMHLVSMIAINFQARPGPDYVNKPEYRKQTTYEVPRKDVLKMNVYNPYFYNEEKMIVEYDWKAKLIGKDLNFKYECKEITFEECCKAWKIMWPARNPLPTHSTWNWSMDECIVEQHQLAPYMIGIDKDIYNYNATYFGVYIDNKLVGVNSGHQTSEQTYRSRGLWVHPKYRGRKIAILLLKHTIKASNGLYAWTCPRKESEYAYRAVGFNRRSDYYGKPHFKEGTCCFSVREPDDISEV